MIIDYFLYYHLKKSIMVIKIRKYLNERRQSTLLTWTDHHSIEESHILNKYYITVVDVQVTRKGFRLFL